MTSALEYQGQSAGLTNYNPRRIVSKTVYFQVFLDAVGSASFDLGGWIGPTKAIDYIDSIIVNSPGTAIQFGTTAGNPNSTIPVAAGSIFMGPILWGSDNRIMFIGSSTVFLFTLCNFPISPLIIP